MKIIAPSYHILDELDNSSLVTRLEACGRICYKSEARITNESAMPFVKKIASQGHNSVLEMGAVSLRVCCSDPQFSAFLLCQPKYLQVDRLDTGILVTGSIRAFRELYGIHADDALVQSMVVFLAKLYPYLFEGICTCEEEAGASDIQIRSVEKEEVDQLPFPLQLRHRYLAVKFIVNRAVTHELVRHRTCSFLQESQRYCRYNQDKFENQVTFIKPMFFTEDSAEYAVWYRAMEETEKMYLQLLETVSPQAARTVLPNSCKTEIIVYCNLAEWQHIFRLRTDTAAEPSMREIMIPLAQEMMARYPAVQI